MGVIKKTVRLVLVLAVLLLVPGVIVAQEAALPDWVYKTTSINDPITIGRVVALPNTGAFATAFNQVNGGFMGVISGRFAEQIDAQERIALALEAFRANNPDFYDSTMTTLGLAVTPKPNIIAP